MSTRKYKVDRASSDGVETIYIIDRERSPGASYAETRAGNSSVCRPDGPSQIADMIVKGSLDAAKLGEASQVASREIGFEPDRATTGSPRSKMGRVATKAMAQIRRFEAPAGEASALRSCEISWKCVAVGARFRERFREMAAVSSVRGGRGGAVGVFLSWKDISAEFAKLRVWHRMENEGSRSSGHGVWLARGVG